LPSKGAGVRPIRNPLVRYYGRGDLHFVTFSCYRRRPYLGTRRARDRFVKVLEQVRARWSFPLIGYVLMPEHVHLLMGEPPKGNPSNVVQVLKQKTSRVLRGRRRKSSVRQLSLRFTGAEEDAAHFWQRRFYDFNVWSAKKLREKLEYMHFNPVKRKLVSHPKDWPWSSWSYYEKGQQGLIAIDFAGEESNTTTQEKVKIRTLGKRKGAAPTSS
jgi:putative transposase